MTTDLLSSLAPRIAANALGVLAGEKIDNPYLSASLAPFIETFIFSVWDGLTGPSTAMTDGYGEALMRECLAQTSRGLAGRFS